VATEWRSITITFLHRGDRELKRLFPKVKISGGISNQSFPSAAMTVRDAAPALLTPSTPA
jgi:hypothetical protein